MAQRGVWHGLPGPASRRPSRRGSRPRVCEHRDAAAIIDHEEPPIEVGECPLSVGFFFARGHSTVVVSATVAIAATAAALQSRFEEFREVGGVIGTRVSAFLAVDRHRQPGRPDWSVAQVPSCLSRRMKKTPSVVSTNATLR